MMLGVWHFMSFLLWPGELGLNNIIKHSSFEINLNKEYYIICMYFKHEQIVQFAMLIFLLLIFKDKI